VAAVLQGCVLEPRTLGASTRMGERGLQLRPGYGFMAVSPLLAPLALIFVPVLRAHQSYATSCLTTRTDVAVVRALDTIAVGLC
jgi:hypothetical protein